MVKTFVVPQNTFVSWNAQATLSTAKESLWALYLPTSVHGRVSDIWRSYITQRLVRELRIHTAFAVKPIVQQNRNPHSYLANFDAGNDMYKKSGALIDFLDTDENIG